MKENSARTGMSHWTSAILGALAGAGAVLLLKKKNREKLKSGMEKIKEVGNRYFSSMKKGAEEVADKAEKRVEEEAEKITEE